MKKITIPADYRKRTTFASNLYYDTLEIYDNRIVGYLNGNQTMTWYFKEYSGIDVIKANLNSQFAQIVFLTGMNSNNRALGLDFSANQNAIAMNDVNRILFCSGMFSFGKTNSFADEVAKEVRTAFEEFKNNEGSADAQVVMQTSAADELKKFKALLDEGIITAEEFEAKKKQLLGM